MGVFYRLTSVGGGGAITETTVQTLTDRPVGAHSSAVFLVNITTITGTWTIAAQLNVGGALINIAEAQHTTTGLKVLSLATSSNFDGAALAIPEANSMTYTEDAAGTLVAEVFVGYGG